MNNIKEDFIIRINDGFCEWEFGIKLIDDFVSINDIIDVIVEKFPGKVTYSKHIPELNN